VYSLHLTCRPDEVEDISAELWERDTAGIRELEQHDSVTLIAGFETNEWREFLLHRFAACAPEWVHEEDTDWVQATRDAWPARAVGERLFLAPPWSEEKVPDGRLRLIHNPGLACGTGEHPCTQMALQAIERIVQPGDRVADIGTGSGILAIGAALLDAGVVVGVDKDEASLRAAKQNYMLNHLPPNLVAGSAGALRSNWADVTVANISGGVLLHIWDELLRVTASTGHIIVTGFTRPESPVFEDLLPQCSRDVLNEWCCLSAPKPVENS
jgi:ribosomal protein L11 methyltransferase